MSPVPKQICSSFFFFFALVLNLIFLASFGGNKYALAQFSGPDRRYPPPPGPNLRDESDYPSNEEIEGNFLGTGPDQTLVMVMSRSDLPRYQEYCTTPALGLKCVFNAWPPRYLTRGGPNGELRSQRWFRDFYFRYNNIYMRGATGTAFILVSSLWDDNRCGYFIIVIATLLDRDRIDRIVLVAARDWNQQRIWWDRRRDDDGTRSNGGDPDDGSGGNDGSGNNALGSATLLFLPTAVSGFVGAALDHAVKSTIPPVPQVFSGDGQNKDQGVNPLKFPLETDIWDSPIASLPSSDNTAVGANGEIRMSSKDETSALEPQTDETSSTSKTNSQTADSGNPDIKSLFQRRRRKLLSRDGADCLDWLTESDFPDDPIQPSAPAAATSSDLVTAPSVQTDFNVENLVEKLNIGVKEEVATLSVTQYDRSSANPDFELDIKVSDSQGNMLHYEQLVHAPSGEKIKVSLSDPRGSFLWPLFLTTGKNRDDPLQIQYGDFLLIGPQTDWGRTFDSSDPRQKCTVSAWADSKRETKCSIIVARRS